MNSKDLLARNLAHLRDQCRLKRTELAELTGIPYSSLCAMESTSNSRSAQLSRLDELAKFFKIELCKLIGADLPTIGDERKLEIINQLNARGNDDDPDR